MDYLNDLKNEAKNFMNTVIEASDEIKQIQEILKNCPFVPFDYPIKIIIDGRNCDAMISWKQYKNDKYRLIYIDRTNNIEKPLDETKSTTRVLLLPYVREFAKELSIYLKKQAKI